MRNQFTVRRLVALGLLAAAVFTFIAWQQATNPPRGIEFTATRGQFRHYIPHVIVMALIVIAADFAVLWYGWKRYVRERTAEPVTDAADARLNPLRGAET